MKLSMPFMASIGNYIHMKNGIYVFTLVITPPPPPHHHHHHPHPWRDYKFGYVIVWKHIAFWYRFLLSDIPASGGFSYIAHCLIIFWNQCLCCRSQFLRETISIVYVKMVQREPSIPYSVSLPTTFGVLVCKVHKILLQWEESNQFS